ncbi:MULTISPECIES: hypothetical protein [unclassified Streptomyces]|uniref:hypothetical protein n=1 Tax=unclassified Streptomyces TaxID=2593676 RepID=UPI00225B4FA7|nr:MULTISPECIES: hypothetical protein [unclassified Streptomyces]MCX4527810.1 hypothetical protein [Streptomyces sp. NBC_01551]MCX4541593.1 hypothetical protein [Streptomyces sp. NBC_01565]
MIGEPEWDGDWESGRAAEEAEAVESGLGEPARARAPWVWALGGIVVASAVWAGTLTVLNRFADAGPPIAYRHSENLCGEEPLTALGKTLSSFDSGLHREQENPAVDWASCMHSAGDRTMFMATTLVQLHKKTDPRAEFGAGPSLSMDMVDSAPANQQQVPGLGERAIITHVTGGTRGPRLEVLDGGAEFMMTVDWWGEEGRAEPDEDAVKSAMIEDMRALMARLKK